MLILLVSNLVAEPHGSVGSVVDLRTGGRWPDSQLGQYSFQGLMIVIATGFIPLSPLVRCFDNSYLGKQPVVWKDYCAEYWLKEVQESIDRCTGCRDITGILLKVCVKHHTINELNLVYKIKSSLDLSE